MKKLLAFLFLLTFCFVSPAFGLIVTVNVDKDAFQYEVGYKFATQDLAASLTAVDVPVGTEDLGHNFEYVIPRDARVVGMSVASNRASTSGAATFDVVINSTVTGIQAVIDASVVRSAVGTSGSSGSQYSFIRQDRASTTVAQGFRAENGTEDKHDADHPYGKATAITAGNRIGVQVTTSSGFSVEDDFVVVIYVLE